MALASSILTTIALLASSILGVAEAAPMEQTSIKQQQATIASAASGRSPDSMSLGMRVTQSPFTMASASSPAGSNVIPSPIPHPNPDGTSHPSRWGTLMTRTVGSYINVRTQPTTRSPRQGYGLRGDRVVILDRQGGLHDGHQWVQVEFPQRGVQGWIRADFVVGTAGAEAAISPAASPAAAPVSVQRSKLRTPSPQTSASPVSTTPVQTAPVSAAPVQAAPTQAAPVRAARPSAALAPSAVQQPSAYGRPTGNRYTADDISYFTEIALGSEFGNATHRIRKWEEDIRIRVHGQPTAADHAALDAVVRDLSGLIAGNNGDGPSIEVVEGARVADANVDMYFVPHQEFRRYEPHYQPGNLGFAYVNWNRDRIHRARILITTVDISQTERDHLIREELTQSLGLLRDSYRHTDSIFYQGWTRTTAFSPLDQRIIQMLYHRDVEPGMTGRQIRAALGQTASIAAR